jgi:hypothetical protein
LHITSLGLDSWQAYRHCRADGGEPQTGFFSNNLNDEAAVTPEQFGVAVNEAFANEQAVLDGAVPAYVVSCS